MSSAGPLLARSQRLTVIRVLISAAHRSIQLALPSPTMSSRGLPERSSLDAVYSDDEEAPASGMAADDNESSYMDLLRQAGGAALNFGASYVLGTSTAVQVTPAAAVSTQVVSTKRQERLHEEVEDEDYQACELRHGDEVKENIPGPTLALSRAGSHVPPPPRSNTDAAAAADSVGSAPIFGAATAVITITVVSPVQERCDTCSEASASDDPSDEEPDEDFSPAQLAKWHAKQEAKRVKRHAEQPVRREKRRMKKHQARRAVLRKAKEAADAVDELRRAALAAARAQNAQLQKEREEKDAEVLRLKKVQETKDVEALCLQRERDIHAQQERLAHQHRQEADRREKARLEEELRRAPGLAEQRRQDSLHAAQVEVDTKLKEEFLQMFPSRQVRATLHAAPRFVLIIGSTQTGKSTFLNYMLGGEAGAAAAARTGDTLRSCTSEVRCYLIPHTNVYLIDTPGLEDTGDLDDVHMFKILHFLVHHKQPLHDIIMLQSVGRPFTAGLRAAVKLYCDMFPDLFKRLVLLVSNFSQSEHCNKQREHDGFSLPAYHRKLAAAVRSAADLPMSFNPTLFTIESRPVDVRDFAHSARTRLALLQHALSQKPLDIALLSVPKPPKWQREDEMAIKGKRGELKGYGDHIAESDKDFKAYRERSAKCNEEVRKLESKLAMLNTEFDASNTDEEEEVGRQTFALEWRTFGRDDAWCIDTEKGALITRREFFFAGPVTYNENKGALRVPDTHSEGKLSSRWFRGIEGAVVLWSLRRYARAARIKELLSLIAKAESELDEASRALKQYSQVAQDSQQEWAEWSTKYDAIDKEIRMLSDSKMTFAQLQERVARQGKAGAAAAAAATAAGSARSGLP